MRHRVEVGWGLEELSSMDCTAMRMSMGFKILRDLPSTHDAKLPTPSPTNLTRH
jgi:hypothetical protein